MIRTDGDPTIAYAPKERPNFPRSPVGGRRPPGPAARGRNFDPFARHDGEAMPRTAWDRLPGESTFEPVPTCEETTCPVDGESLVYDPVTKRGGPYSAHDSEESLGPVVNPDGTPTDFTLAMFVRHDYEASAPWPDDSGCAVCRRSLWQHGGDNAPDTEGCS